MHLDYNQGEQHQLRSNIVLVLSLPLVYTRSLSLSRSLLLSLSVESRLLVISNLVISPTLSVSLVLSLIPPIRDSLFTFSSCYHVRLGLKPSNGSLGATSIGE